MIHIYTGDGKGKTTAAAGLAARALGHGFSVAFVQLSKKGDSGEMLCLNHFENFHLFAGKITERFVSKMTAEEREKTRMFHMEHFEKAIELKPFLLVLDEMGSALKYNVFDRDVLIYFLKNPPFECETVLTGRDFDEEILNIADYVSEIKKIRHPFDRGITARKGIER